MFSRRLLSFVLLLTLVAGAAGQEAKHALTNDDIAKLAKGGFTDDVIVALIEASDTAFDVSIGGMTALKDAGVSSKVMESMLKAEAKKRQGASVPPVTSGSTQAPAPMQSPPMMTLPNPAMAAGLGGTAYTQQIMAMAMSSSGMGAGGGAPGMLDPRQLPPLVFINGDTRQTVKPSIAQIASTTTKGDGMPGAGSEATGMLMGLGRQALSFGALGGSMFAGPGAGMAMGMMGSLGSMGHHGPPKVTYVWALPGQQSGFVISTLKPRFEMSYGNLLGIDPDAYEPQLVKLVNSKDNWRLVGATKTTMGQMSTEAYEKVTEARIKVEYQLLGRGQMQLEPKQPLEPGEYAIVLRAVHPGKRAAGSLGGGAETSIFFSVWDFSVNSAGK